MLFAAMGMMLASCSESTPVEEPKVDDTQENNSSDNDLDGDPRFIEYSEADKAVLNGVNDFSFNLIGLISKYYNDAVGLDDGNFVFSPVTESLSLAMLANAGDATLQNQLLRALGTESLDELNSTSAKMMRTLPSETSGAFLTIANSVWALPGSTIADVYKTTLTDAYEAEYCTADFATQQGIDLINSWTANATNNKITMLLSRPSDQIYAIWISALTFEGEWMDKFDKTLTTDAEFFGTRGTSTVRMMHRFYEQSLVAQVDGYTMAHILFGGPAELYLIQPSKGIDIDEASSNMSSALWDKLYNNLKNAKLNLSMPHLDITTDINFNPVLGAMGVDANNVNIENIQFQFPPLNKSLLFAQKSVLHIDEDGASAASVAHNRFTTDRDGQEVPPTIDMNLNRPFFFFFRNQMTGNIILAGRVCNL